MLKSDDHYNVGPFTSPAIRDARISMEAERRKREKLDRNRQRASEPTYGPHDIRNFDKAITKRDDPKLPPKVRLQAADRAIEIQERHAHQRDAHWRETAIAETVELSGGTVSRLKSGGAKRDYAPGISFLLSKGRLQADQAEAAKRYGDDYRLAEGSVKSCLNNAPAGSPRAEKEPPDVVARRALKAARHSGLFDQAPWIEICNAVCGRGYKITDLRECKVRQEDGSLKANGHKAAVLEERLQGALNMLALHYKIAPVIPLNRERPA